jgi:hypothetical protein
MIDIDLTPLRSKPRNRGVDPELKLPETSLSLSALHEGVRRVSVAVGKSGGRASYFLSPVRPKRGATFFALALIILGAGLVVDIYRPLPWARSSYDMLRVVGWMAAALLLVRGWVCFRPTAEAIVARDGRRPIVYLRSFKDDSAIVATRYRPFAVWANLTMVSWKYLRSLKTSPFQHGVRLEQVVARELGRFAPFVAIGEPGESYPDFGATRAYFEEDGDEAWQAKVREWINCSSIIVLVPGLTPGLAWELKQVLEGKFGGKLVMVMPADRPKARQARMALAAKICSDPKWREAFEIEPSSELLAVFSTSDGSMVRVMCSHPKEEELKIALELAALCVLGDAGGLLKQSDE